ncbi:hypothetical protein LPJ54_000130 [Coemansia sp. RSA 1824]|nr:hypothetical protein LPJ54_000130 [Coemansia sp. RSA 1824]
MVLRLVISMKHNLYSMFAASPTSGGGLGFSPRNIDTSLVLWLLLLVYPFNSHLAWVVCGLVTATAWRLSLRLPDSVNIYLPGKNQRNRR